MNVKSKFTDMNQLLINMEILASKFDQPFAAFSDNKYIADLFVDIDNVYSCINITGFCLDEVLNKLKSILTLPFCEEDYISAVKIVSILYECIKKWYFVNIHNENTYNDILLSNFFHTQYKKNALMIYILHPFIFPDEVPQHTNQPEARAMADVLSDMGYNVDIINIQYNGELSYDSYDLVIGSGPKFDEACLRVGESSRYRTICYLTESSPYFSNIAELKRLRDFEKRNNRLFAMERQSTRLFNISALIKADAAICLGNRQTAFTYENVFHKIYSLNVSGFSNCPLPALTKNSQENRKHFLWYGGAGPIHKGLDLCIETFRILPELHLAIVGELPDEFYQFYKSDIENLENISYYGFLTIDSLAYRQVAEQCGFCIVPSCSEGQSTAVITAMFSGILPVCTREIGIDLLEAGGFVIEDIRIDRLVLLVQKLSKIDENEFLIRQQQVYRYVSDNHTIEKYSCNLRAILDDITV